MSVIVQSGSEGEWVVALQEALNAAGYELDVDGSFGDNTEAAVIAFQRENRLAADGVVGPNTWAALGIETHSHHNKRSSDVVYLERGSRGDAVRVLQSALVGAGYELDVDGAFGDDTDAAVRAFQEENDLDADGVVGPNTWNALQEFIA